MRILVINAGSSSLKYQLLDMQTEEVLAKGICERIGAPKGSFTNTQNGQTTKKEVTFSDHSAALRMAVAAMGEGEGAPLYGGVVPDAIGHRVAHGGEKLLESALITAEVLATIEELGTLAPLHNPAHVLAMRAAAAVFSERVPQVASFDTAFHRTMPPESYLYALPMRFYKEYGVRKYGFHGLSHQFVSARLQTLTGGKKLIVCHLGNGSSITAVENGESVDTTMGFTPLDGLVMGTRSGAIDPTVVTYLAEREGVSARKILQMLNKESGFLGITGTTSDHRDICERAERGDERAQIAHKMLCYQVRRYIGAFAAAMDGVDAIAFTGGIGENSVELRRDVSKKLTYLGVELSDDQNAAREPRERCITTKESRVSVWVVPTNEELAIARETKRVIGGQ